MNQRLPHSGLGPSPSHCLVTPILRLSSWPTSDPQRWYYTHSQIDSVIMVQLGLESSYMLLSYAVTVIAHSYLPTWYRKLRLLDLSHTPSIKNRESNLAQLQLNVPHCHIQTWCLFDNWPLYYLYQKVCMSVYVLCHYFHMTWNILACIIVFDLSRLCQCL